MARSILPGDVRVASAHVQSGLTKDGVISSLYRVSCGLEMIYGGGLDVIPAMACVMPARLSSVEFLRLGGCAVRKSVRNKS